MYNYRYGSSVPPKSALEAIQKHLRKLLKGDLEWEELKKISLSTVTKENKPLDAQSFYESFGLLEHPATAKPVEELAEYQKALWNDGFRHKYRLTIKSQKIGLTTTTLMEDFQRAILPSTNRWSCMGKQILVIAQTLKHANEHLNTLRRMILQSTLYSRFLIMERTEGVLRDEITKVETLYIKNPWNVSKAR